MIDVLEKKIVIQAVGRIRTQFLTATVHWTELTPQSENLPDSNFQIKITVPFIHRQPGFISFPDAVFCT